MAELNVDVTRLPEDVREKLAELELELSEGKYKYKYTGSPYKWFAVSFHPPPPLHRHLSSAEGYNSAPPPRFSTPRPSNQRPLIGVNV